MYFSIIILCIQLKTSKIVTNLNISKLPTTDKEIAYTLDKGEVIKFRWEDSSRYIPIDVYMYVLLHELTHESFPPSFQGHGDPFPQMLCLLCVAATELKILDIPSFSLESVENVNGIFTNTGGLKYINL